MLLTRFVMRDMNVHVIHVTKYSAAIGSRQTDSRLFHTRSVDPSDSISECIIVAIPFATSTELRLTIYRVAIPFGNHFIHLKKITGHHKS